LSICDIFYLANRRAKEQDLLEIYQANVQIKKTTTTTTHTTNFELIDY